MYKRNIIYRGGINMKKAKRTALFLLPFVLCSVIISIHTAFGSSISVSQLENVRDGNTKKQIAKIVLEDTGKSIPDNELDSVKVEIFMENTMGNDEDDAIISVSYGPKHNVTAVYQKEKGRYEFAGSLGEFFAPKNIIVKNFKYGNPLIFLSDYTNQKVGALEESTYLYGNVWDEETEEFVNVFTEPMNINTQWLENGVWQKVERKGSAVYENSAVPNIKSDFEQAYYTAEDRGTKTSPDAEVYNLVEDWQEQETYYWSREWGRFIVEEKIEKSTGEKVAVVSRWEKLPYSRTPEFEEYSDYERIIRKDGTNESVNKDSLSTIENRTFKEFKNM